MPDTGVSIWGTALRGQGDAGGGGGGSSAATYIYASTTDGKILRVTLADGTTTSLTGVISTGLRGLAIDAASGYIYACDRTSNSVFRFDLDGSNQTTKFTNGADGVTLSDPYDLDLDKENGILYVGDEFAIRILNLDGTTSSIAAGESLGLTYDKGRNELVNRLRSSQFIRVFALPGQTATDYAENQVNGFGGPQYVEANDDYVYPNAAGGTNVIDRTTGTVTSPNDGTDWGHTEFNISFDWLTIDEVARRIYHVDSDHNEIKIANFSYEAVTSETISVPALRGIEVDNHNG